MITVIVSNSEYEFFLDVSVTISFETLSNNFSFTATSNNGFPPFKKGELVQIKVDGELVCTGFIEEINGNFTGNNHTISYAGRDKTGDFVDSQIDKLNDLKNESLKGLIEKVAKDIGSDLKVIDTIDSPVFDEVEDQIKIQAGDNCWDTVAEFAKKRQVFLTSDAEGNITIKNSEPTDTGSVLQHVIDAEENNVISASFTLTDKERFNRYSLRGQPDPIGMSLIPNPDTKTAAKQASTPIIDENIREGRQFVEVKAKHSSESLKKRAEWVKQVREARGDSYSCQVQGFRNVQGNLWDINQLATIVDDFADINRKMLINEVTFSYSLGGSLTDLSFVEKNAYVLLEQEPKEVGSEMDIFQALRDI